MIDVKKFVVFFLILAGLASSSAFILIGFSNSSVNAVTANISQAAGGAFSVTPGNAFKPSAYATSTESLLEIAAEAASTTASSSDPNNLTQQLASSIVNNLVSQNPNGPRTNTNGDSIATFPSVNGVLADLGSSTAYQNVQVPDWDFEAAKITMKTSNDTSDPAIAEYSNTVNGVVNTYLVKSNVQGMVGTSGNADASNLPFIRSQIQGALDNISALTAPTNLAGFQKSLVKVLVYQKNAIDLVQNASDDPVKAGVIFQVEGQKYAAASQEFMNELQKASTNKAFSFAYPREGTPGKNGIVAFVDSLLGIKTAHAQWVVFDPSLFTRMVWEYLQSILLQIMKNFLVSQMQNALLGLVQNGGNQRFAGQWGMLLYNTFNSAAGSGLGQIVPGLCQQYSADVTSWLKNVFPSANIKSGGFSLNGAGGTNCTLQNSVNNIPGFYNDFNVGGFNGFAALLLPNNNPWGTFAQAYDTVSLVSGAQSAATQNKFTSGAGYSAGAQFCDDGSQPNPGDGNLCDDGSEPFTTLPGSSVADSLARNLNSNIDLIVNANDITGIVAAVAGALMQQVLQNGQFGILGAHQSQGGGQQPPPLPVTCNNSQRFASTSAQVYYSATGGNSSNYSWVSNGGNPLIGTGPVFVTSYAFTGTYTATVTGQGQSGQEMSTCTITIN